MTGGRRAAALIAIVLSGAACGSSAAAPAAAPGTGAAPSSSAPAPAPTTDLLDSQPATLDALRTEQARRPVQVLVPGVAQAAPVEPRTTDPVSGGLDVPEGADSVAWWASGASPGTGSGSVVLAAHVSFQGDTGPFTGLSRVAPGTEVVVVSADGTRHAYAVQSTRNAAKTSLDRAELFRTAGPPALVLVTCGGAYDPKTRSYEENVVVTAVPA